MSPILVYTLVVVILAFLAGYTVRGWVGRARAVDRAFRRRIY
jgi:hypothetical protein